MPIDLNALKASCEDMVKAYKDFKKLTAREQVHAWPNYQTQHDKCLDSITLILYPPVKRPCHCCGAEAQPRAAFCSNCGLERRDSPTCSCGSPVKQWNNHISQQWFAKYGLQ
jgi:hypothetical protein